MQRPFRGALHIFFAEFCRVRLRERWPLNQRGVVHLRLNQSLSLSLPESPSRERFGRRSGPGAAAAALSAPLPEERLSTKGLDFKARIARRARFAGRARLNHVVRLGARVGRVVGLEPTPTRFSAGRFSAELSYTRREVESEAHRA